MREYHENQDTSSLLQQGVAVNPKGPYTLVMASVMAWEGWVVFICGGWVVFIC